MNDYFRLGDWPFTVDIHGSFNRKVLIDIYAPCGSYQKSFAIEDCNHDIKALLIRKFPEAPYKDLSVLITAINALITNPGYPTPQFFEDIEDLKLTDEELEDYPALRERQEEEQQAVELGEERRQDDESEK